MGVALLLEFFEFVELRAQSMLECAITNWLTLLLCIHKVLDSISPSTMSKTSLVSHAHVIILQLNNIVDVQ